MVNVSTVSGVLFRKHGYDRHGHRVHIILKIWFCPDSNRTQNLIKINLSKVMSYS